MHYFFLEIRKSCDRNKKALPEFELRENMEALSFLLYWDFCRVLIFLPFPRTRTLLLLKCKLSLEATKILHFLSSHDFLPHFLADSLQMSNVVVQLVHRSHGSFVDRTVLSLVFHPSRESEICCIKL